MDFHEERKWKKSCAIINAHNIKKHIEKKEKNKKVKNLYKKFYPLYLTINYNYNILDRYSPNKNDKLDYYLYNNVYNNTREITDQLYKWKKKLKEYETELKLNIKLDNININKFTDIINYIKKNINIQEEKKNEIYKYINNTNIYNSFPDNLSDYSKLLKYTCNLNTMRNDDTIILEGEESYANYNKINSNLKNLFNGIADDNSSKDIGIEELNFSELSNSFSNNINKNNKKLFYTEINNSSSLSQNIYKIEYEEKLFSKVNPMELIFSSYGDIEPKSIIDHFKNNYNYNIDEICILPNIDTNKMRNFKYDLNDIKYDKKNAYYNIFPDIENEQNKLEYKKMIDELLNNKSKQNNTYFEEITRYNNLTPLQKLVILYGIFTTGNNPYIINFILNSYYPTSCTLYSIDEMNFITEKILDEIGINYESNYTNIKSDIFNKDKNNRFYLGSSQLVEIEPVFYQYECSEFEFYNTIQKLSNINVKDNDKNIEEYYKIYLKNRKNDEYNSKFDIINKNISVQKHILLSNVLTNNPYVENNQIKKFFFKNYINYLKELCKTINKIKNENKSKFNYFTGEVDENNQRQKNDINYEEIKINKSKKLNKNDVLNQIRNNKNKFKTYSIRKYKEGIAKKININNIEANASTNTNLNKKENLNENIDNILNKFSEYNIKNNWDNMKDEWYQNNRKLNYIFKLKGISNNENDMNDDFESVFNANNKEGKDDKIKFCSILNLKINQ